jgi:hypothetical protein
VASGTIAGAIVDNAGKPAAVQVDLFDAHGDCSRELAHVTSDVSDGQFAFTGLPIWDGTAAHNSLYVIVLHKTPAQIARSNLRAAADRLREQLFWIRDVRDRHHEQPGWERHDPSELAGHRIVG